VRHHVRCACQGHRCLGGATRLGRACARSPSPHAQPTTADCARHRGEDRVAPRNGIDSGGCLRRLRHVRVRRPRLRRVSPTLDRWLRDLNAARLAHRRITKAYAVVRAALAWEVKKGRLGVNPAREVRRTTTKKGRARRATADPVLLPSWEELARLASHADLLQDRLLILLIAWAGLRWTESISISVKDLWLDRPRLSIARVYVWDVDGKAWEIEDVKAGLTATVPVPRPLWEALTAYAASLTVEDRLGGDLLFRPLRMRFAGRHPVIIDQSDWGKRVWRPAREAAGLTGDLTLPPLDPRRRAIQIKDLRAYAASVIVDSGGTVYDAAQLLRHSDINTTNKYYARAQDERSQDPARARLRLDPGLPLHHRIDALWEAWTTSYPLLTKGLFSADS
jgi:integrase